MNAPVSIDGGGGFNKVVILGTEFADHIVVTAHGDLRRRPVGHLHEHPGARDRRARGRRHDRRPVDRAGRRDARHRRARQRHRQRRPATSSATSSRGTSRARAGRSTTWSPRPTRTTTASSSNGVDLSVARPGQGQVIIKESDGFSALYEGGAASRRRPSAACRRSTRTRSCSPQRRRPNVYVTVSAAGSPQEEHRPATRSSCRRPPAARPTSSAPSRSTASRPTVPTSARSCSSSRRANWNVAADRVHVRRRRLARRGQPHRDGQPVGHQRRPELRRRDRAQRRGHDLRQRRAGRARDAARPDHAAAGQRDHRARGDERRHRSDRRVRDPAHERARGRQDRDGADLAELEPGLPRRAPV